MPVTKRAPVAKPDGRMGMYEELDQTDQRIVDVVRLATAAGAAPSYREIGQAVGLRSPSSVCKRLEALEARGVIRRPPGKRRAIELVRETAPVPVPLLGEVRAGAPLLAEQQIAQRFLLPREFVGDGDLFMLRVRGDSMTGAGIADGDHVVVRSQPQAEHGEIVAAQLDDGQAEATVKYLARRDGRVELRAANPDYAPIDGRHATILGKVVTVLRRL
jgi:repressor LexA